MNQMEAKRLIRNGWKIRFHAWWWGKYIQKHMKRIVDQDGNSYPSDLGAEEGWEVYSEEAHGRNNETK